MVRTLAVIARRAAFNQALAIPIGLLIGMGSGSWLPSFVVATMFSQCIGALCWGSSAVLGRHISTFARWKMPAWLALYFVDGVLGAEVATRICRSVFGYNMGEGFNFFSLAIGASIAVLVGLVMTMMNDLQVNLESTEQALRDRELAEARLQQARTDAELAALQARINPHFLFNALNSIAALIGEDPAKAEAVTWQLSSLFRYALQANARGLVTVDEEMTIVRRYLEIEQVRLGDRLRFEIDVASELAALEIPALLLQPLVENAIKHGIAPQVEGGNVRVHGRRMAGQAVFTISDTGGRMVGTTGAGVGLANVRQRLESTYGPGASVSLARADGVTVTRVTIPISGAGQAAIG